MKRLLLKLSMCSFLALSLSITLGSFNACTVADIHDTAKSDTIWNCERATDQTGLEQIDGFLYYRTASVEGSVYQQDSLILEIYSTLTLTPNSGGLVMLAEWNEQILLIDISYLAPEDKPLGQIHPSVEVSPSGRLTINKPPASFTLELNYMDNTSVYTFTTRSGHPRLQRISPGVVCLNPIIPRI